MTDINSGCAVVFPNKTQSHNCSLQTATSYATSDATHDLFTLSMQILGQYNATGYATSGATEQLRSNVTNATDATIDTVGNKQLLERRSATNQKTCMVDTFPWKSCAVAFCIGGNDATEEFYSLVKQVSDYYGCDDPQFIEEYISDLMKSNGLDKSLICFHNLAKQIQCIKNKK